MRKRRLQLLAVVAGAVAAVPAAAFATPRLSLPPWMERMMRQAPPEMQRHMDTPEMQQMMDQPEMRRMMDDMSPAQMQQLMRSPDR